MTREALATEGAGKPSLVLTWIGRLRLPPSVRIAVAAALFLLGLILLGRQIRGVSLPQISTALEATPPGAIVLATGATALSYAFLMVSEWWALALVGRRLELRRIALATTVSYAVANGLGFGVATGAAARMRLYGGWGMGPSEAAAVFVLAGLAVTFSGLVCAGFGLLWAASAQPGVLALALVLLAPGLLWIGRPPSRLWFLPGVTLTPVPPGRGLAALLGGVADWLASAAVLFLLLPGAEPSQFPGFVVIFVLGSIGSALSGVPGGVGVFEAIVLGLSRDLGAPGETAAALLLYRLIYTLGPLAVTLLGAGTVQAFRFIRSARASELHAAADLLAPPVAALLTFYAGAALVLASTNAPVQLVVPGVIEGGLARSALLSSVTGALLVVLAAALWRRQEGGYYAVVALLLGGSGAELWKGFGWSSAAALLFVALMLAPCRGAFDRRSALLRDIASPAWTTAVALCSASAWMLITIEAARLPPDAEPWWEVVTRTGRAGALGVATALAGLALLLGVWRLLGPVHRPSAAPSEGDMKRVREILGQTQALHLDAFLALMTDKAIIFSPSGRSFVMYRSVSDRWIAMGDPVGPPEDRRDAIAAFVAAADAQGVSPAFYGVEQECLPDLVASGFATFKIGESASVSTSGFSLEGRQRADLRHAYNHAQRTGHRFRVYAAGDPETPWIELGAVSRAWLERHSGREKSFSLGAFDTAYLRNFPIAVLEGPRGVVAFANIVASPDRSCFGIDLMRSLPDALRSAMDALFVHLIFWGREAGFQRFELGMAPLAGLDRTGVDSWSRRAERWIYRTGEALYGFQGLRSFKEKYVPDWRPVFVAAPAGVSPLFLLADVALLTSGGGRGLAHRPQRERRRPGGEDGDQ